MLGHRRNGEWEKDPHVLERLHELETGSFGDLAQEPCINCKCYHGE